MKKWIRILLIILAVIGAAIYSTITTIDRSHYLDSEFFRTTDQRLDSLESTEVLFSGDTLKIGWSMVNLTPPFITSLAGYGAGEFDSVTDSVWCRVFVFDNGQSRIALIAPDLLIFPPVIRNLLTDQVDSLGVDGLFYSATHTHHSVGNWHPGLIGRIFAGPYRHDLAVWITEQVKKGIREASLDLKRSRIGFAAIQAEDLVFNRLVKELGTVDPWLRLITIEQDSGETAVITSFSAHATTFPRNIQAIHRDYPGKLVDLLERTNRVDFAAFIAGAMGSHGPGNGSEDDNTIREIAQDAAAQVNLILNVVQPDYYTTLGFLSIDVALREPQFRITRDLRLRAWLVDILFGQYDPAIDALMVGKNLLIGTPCDFSGELVSPLDKNARSANLNLIITSFNGGYIGYITKDEWYDLHAYETRTMNWFGPGNGDYFSHIVERMMTIMSAKAYGTHPER